MLCLKQIIHYIRHLILRVTPKDRYCTICHLLHTYMYIRINLHMCAMYHLYVLCIHDSTCVWLCTHISICRHRGKKVCLNKEIDGCGIVQTPGHQLEPCKFGGAWISWIGLYWQGKLSLKRISYLRVCWLGNSVGTYCTRVLLLSGVIVCRKRLTQQHQHPLVTLENVDLFIGRKSSQIHRGSGQVLVVEDRSMSCCVFHVFPLSKSWLKPNTTYHLVI